MPYCAVYGCKNHNSKKNLKNIKFYKFPKDVEFKEQWVKACKRKNKINLENATICSKHFKSDCFFTPLKYRLLNEDPPKIFRNLVPNAIPTLFLHEESGELKNKIISQHPVNNSENLENIQQKDSILSETLANSVNENASLENNELLAELDATKANMILMEEEIRLLKIDKKLETENNTILKSKLIQNKEEIRLLQIDKKLETENNTLLKSKLRQNEEEIRLLQIDKRKLHNENTLLKSKLIQYETALDKHFTPGQVKRILNPNKKFALWNEIDISSAISLRSVSPKAYRFLRKRSFPLPALSTLRRWALQLNLNPRF